MFFLKKKKKGHGCYHGATVRGDEGKDNQEGQQFGEMINQLGLHHHRVAAGCKVKDNQPEWLPLKLGLRKH